MGLIIKTLIDFFQNTNEMLFYILKKQSRMNAAKLTEKFGLTTGEAQATLDWLLPE